VRIVVGIPVLDNVHWKFFLHTTTLVGKLAKKYDVHLCMANRCAIDRARQIVVDTAFGLNADRILFIDDDTIVPLDTVECLEPLFEEDDVIASSGFCYQRGYPYHPMVYQYKDLEWGNAGHSNQLVEPFPEKPFEVSAVGMGICLLNVLLMRQIEGDCFSRDSNGTEDFYFFHKAQKAGFRTMCDPKVEAIHIGMNQMVSSENAKRLRVEDGINFLPQEQTGRGMKAEVKI
jgi:GT2 family glycosyltransferase